MHLDTSRRHNPDDHLRGDRQPDRDALVRSVMALGAVVLFGLVVVLALLNADSWSETRDVLTVVLPVGGVAVGAVLGYLFGRATHSR